MTFSKRMSRLPRALHKDICDEAAKLVPHSDGRIVQLAAHAASSSPYLYALLGKEAEWLLEAVDAPEDALTALYAGVHEQGGKALPVALRQAKRRVALLTALADLSGVWSLEDVTKALTEFAGVATDVAVKACVAQEIQRGKLPGATEADIENAGGLVCLAMGKMGAFELNYSSDIDLICLFDETRFEPVDYIDARTSFVRATRRAMAMLSDLTGDGYVFRTDLRLRPDPAVTPICLSMEAAERYYESLGRTWERAAYIKARACAGDIHAGERFLKTLTPFVWRKHLDFAAIEDAHDMRLRIREHKGFGRSWRPEGHNIKLGRGGIREIEFFTQTRQLIAGGRDTDLRMRETVPALRALAQKGWVPSENAEALVDHYRAHRELEHRIQMVNDAQTHDVPKTQEGLARVAALMDLSVEALTKDISARIESVHGLTEGFFAPESKSGKAADHSHKAFDRDVLSRWRSYPAFRTERANAIFKELEPELLRRLGNAAKPDEALRALDGFLAGLPAGVQLFSLFKSNPQLIDLLSDIVGTAPALARYLSRNASVFDAVIGGDFFSPWPGSEALKGELSLRLGAETDYERKLDAARRWAKEWHFRIGVHHLRGLIDAFEAGVEYADLAEACLAALWPEVVAKFAEKHGPMPGKGAMILGMGSLGSKRLNASSDLDLIAIYDANGVETSDGPRPLASRSYYARLTQALVTALTAPMAEGRLYEVDMRLRPSGTKGPVATSLSSFMSYQQDQAWTWEHLALTRARPVAGDGALCEQVEAFRQSLMMTPSDSAKVRADVIDMRQRIADAKSPESAFDTKIGAGRLQDIELIAQTATLLSGQSKRSVEAGLDAGVAIDWLSAAERTDLLTAYRLFWTVQVAAKLLSEKPLDLDAIGAGGRRFLARETDSTHAEELQARLERQSDTAAQHVARLLTRSTGDMTNG